MKNDPTLAPPGLRVVVTRELNAPCAMVFRAWTEPEQMVQWWSPENIECREVKAEVKAGGAYRIHMVSEKGDHIAYGKYLEVVPNRRLQLTWQWEWYAMPDSRLTVEFEDLGKTTRLTLIHEGLPDQEDADDHERGWTSALAKFAGMIEQHKIKL